MANIDLTRIRAAREELGRRIALTPVWEWQDQAIRERLGEGTRVFLKLELFQHTGTFKARGALVNLLGLDPTARANGVTAVSAGNHAIATAYASKALGTRKLNRLGRAFFDIMGLAGLRILDRIAIAFA